MVHVLDTNIIVRFLTNDDEVQSPESYELFKRAVEGEIVLYLDPLVLAESVWVLNKVYKFAKTDISDKLMKLVEFEGINAPDKNVLLAALEMYQRYNVDYSDAYLAAKAEMMGNAEVITFNTKDFDKMGVNNCTPANISL